MMEQVGKVIGITSVGVEVEVALKSACNHCSNNENCGTASVAKAFNQRTQTLSLTTNKSYPLGTLLRLGLPENIILKAALLLYLFPVFGLLAGGGLGQAITLNFSLKSDVNAILFGIAGAVLMWFIGRHYARQLECQAQPIIIESLGLEIDTAVKMPE